MNIDNNLWKNRVLEESFLIGAVIISAAEWGTGFHNFPVGIAP